MYKVDCELLNKQCMMKIRSSHVASNSGVFVLLSKEKVIQTIIRLVEQIGDDKQSIVLLYYKKQCASFTVIKDYQQIMEKRYNCMPVYHFRWVKLQN